MSDTNYTLTLQVRDAPGVLVRVAHVFARRSCNIISMVVRPRLDGQWSDMTIIVRSVTRIDQISSQLEKQVDIKRVDVYETNDDE